MTNRTRHHLRTLTRRLTLYLLLPLALLLTTRLIWGLESAHRLATVKAYLHSKNIPVNNLPPPLPADEDPFLKLAAIFESTLPLSEARELVYRDPTRPLEEITWSGLDRATMLDILNRCAPAFTAIDEAQRQNIATHPSPDFLKGLSNLRILTHLLTISASINHSAKDDKSALRDINRILFISRIVDQRGTFIGHLTALAIRATAAHAAEYMSADLDLRPLELRNAAQQLARSFANDREMKAALRFSIDSEIARVPKLITDAYNLDGWWISPLRDDAIARSTMHTAHQVDALSEDQWPQVNRLFEEGTAPASNLDIATLSDMLIAGAFHRRHFNATADSRAAAILLAASVYSATHGARLDTLDKLTPEFLPTPLMDPFTPTPQPFHFRFDPAGLTLWSVGENGTDDGGTVQFNSAGERLQRYGKPPTSQSDITYGAAWRTASPPPAPPQTE